MNIIGEGFPNEIIKQVSTRQVVHGQGYSENILSRDINSHLYKNANSAWCRLVSSTEITNLKSLVNTNIPLLGYDGSELARRFILFNGTNAQYGNDPRAGIGFSEIGSDYSNLSYAYTSWGKLNPSVDFGFRPMAGITSVQVKCKNDGALRNAIINIKAWDKMSFEIIDVLYLRLGFSVLLEWGHSMYYDNNFELIKDPYDNNLTDSFLAGDYSYYDFLKLIQNKRLETHGNYDAMFGIVTNFHWSLQPDGSYDIVLNLSSAGSIVESFKVKGNATNSNIISDAGYEPVGLDNPDMDKVVMTYATSNDINAYLYRKWKDIQLSGFRPSTETTWNANYVYTYTDEKTKETIGEAVRVFPDIDYSGAESNYFVRLGDLLKFIQDEVLYKVKNKNDNSAKFLYIDTDTDTNLMHAHSQLISCDPRICMVRRYVIFQKPGPPSKEVQEKIAAQIKKEEEPTKFQLGDMSPEDTRPDWQKTAIDTDRKPITQQELTDYLKKQDEQLAEQNQPPLPPGYDGTFDREYFDPSVEYFAHPYGGKNQAYVDTDKINKFMHDKLSDVGKIMNIYINFRFIIAKLQELSNTDTNSVDLYSFLKELVSNINGAFGGYSKLDLWIDESTNTLKIIDQNPLPSKNSALKYAGLNTNTAFFDLTSYRTSYIEDKDKNKVLIPHAGFIRDFKFDTELTPGYATIIQVSSTSGGNVVGENNTALSKLNRGLKDRFKEEIIGGGKPIKTGISQLEANYQDAYNEWQSFQQNINKFLGHLYDNIYISDEIDSNKAAYTVLQKLYKKFLKAQKDYLGYNPDLKKENNRFEAGTGFIPFNMSLTMDGLSGMKIYSKFDIDSTFLPSNYPDTVEFIIKAIDHDIKDNQWITTLQSMCIAKGNEIGSSVIKLDPKVVNNIIENVEVKGAITPPANYEDVTDQMLFTYLTHQQGTDGATQHYNIAAGKQNKYKSNVPKRNIYQNWPGIDRTTWSRSNYYAKNGVGAKDLKTLYDTDPQKLAIAYIDIQRQLFKKKLDKANDTINKSSTGTNDDGFPIQKIVAYAKKYATANISAEMILTMLYIENGLKISTPIGKKYQTILQLDSTTGTKESEFIKTLKRYEKNGRWVYAKPEDFKYATYEEDVRNNIKTETEKIIEKKVKDMEDNYLKWQKGTGYSSGMNNVTATTVQTPTQPQQPSQPQNQTKVPTKVLSTISGFYNLNTLTANWGNIDLKGYTADCDFFHSFEGTKRNDKSNPGTQISIPVGKMHTAINDELERLKGKGYKAKVTNLAITIQETNNTSFPVISWKAEISESDDGKHWRGFTSRGAGCNSNIDSRWNSESAGNGINSIITNINSVYNLNINSSQILLLEDIIYDGSASSNGNADNSFHQGFYIWTEE